MNPGAPPPGPGAPAPAGGGLPGGGGGSKTKAWATNHKAYLIVGGIAGAVGLIALKKNGGTGSSLLGGSSATTGSTTVPAGGYSSDPYSAAQDAYNSLEPQLEALQGQISGISSGATSTTPAAGFNPGGVEVPYTGPTNSSTPPSGFVAISDPAQGSVFSATPGTDIYADESGELVPVVIGGAGPGGTGQRLAAWQFLPPNTSLYAGPGGSNPTSVAF